MIRHPTVNPAGYRGIVFSDPRDRWFLIICGGLLTLLVALLTVYQPGIIRYASVKSYDLLLQQTPERATSSLPVVVGIDDCSIQKLGQWPWPRYQMARLVERLHDMGVAVIMLDILFSEPDRTSPTTILREIEQELGIDALLFSAPDLPDNDQILAQALRATPSVLGYKFLFDAVANASTVLEPLPSLTNVIVQETPHQPLTLLAAQDVLRPLAPLRQAAAGAGFVNAQTDRDGILRRVPLLMQFEGSLYSGLTLAGYQMLNRLNRERYQDADATAQPLVIQTTPAGIRLKSPDLKLNLDPQGMLLIHYRNPEQPFDYYSACDILTGDIASKALTGKMVIIGAAATGLGDWYRSPWEQHISGPEVHANILDNLLTGHYLYRPAWVPGLELFSVLILGLFGTLLLSILNARWFMLMTLVTPGLVYGLAQGLFNHQSIFVSPLPAILMLLANFSGLSLLKYGLEERRGRQKTQALIEAQDATIIGLSTFAESRDEDTGNHIHRTQHFVRVLADHLARGPAYRRILDPETIELLFKSAPLHDIGKVGIPDSILCKPGPLTPEEFDVMKRHTLIGGAILDKIEQRVPHTGRFSYLSLAREVAVSHHEKWDGTGYPHGIKTNTIPLSGRIMALADVYDALTSARVYKPAFSHEKARRIILEERGTRFDPDVVEAFLANEAQFEEIRRQYQDDPE